MSIAIPSPFSNENFFLTKMMRDQGVEPGAIKTVVLPPPDMPAALENSVEIARRCSTEVTLGKSFLPAFPVPAVVSDFSAMGASRV